MTTSATSSGPSMAATVKPRASIGQYPADRGVTVTKAYQREMGLKSESVAHAKIYDAGRPTVKEQAMALVRAYRAAGDHAGLERFLHDVAHAGASAETSRPLSLEALVEFAQSEASQQVARQSVTLVECQRSAAIWRRRAYEEIAQLHNLIHAVNARYGL